MKSSYFRKSIAFGAVLALSMFTGACQDHHFEPYEKIGPLPEPKPVPAEERKAQPSAPAPAMPPQTAPYSMGGASAQAPAGFAGLIVSGRVELSPATASSAPQGWTLYVIVRPKEGGPALAAKRFDKPVFPIKFELTEKDLMMGTPTAGMEISVEARYDSDGDPMTKKPEDWIGKAAQPAPIGFKGAIITLAR